LISKEIRIQARIGGVSASTLLVLDRYRVSIATAASSIRHILQLSAAVAVAEHAPEFIFRTRSTAVVSAVACEISHAMLTTHESSGDNDIVN
jgi:hypothetical protein